MQDIYLIPSNAQSVSMQAYYTDAHELNALMVSLLGETTNAHVLEPCAGKGAFVKPLLAQGAIVDAIDIDSQHVEELKKIPGKVQVQQGDFIDHFVQDGLFRNIIISRNYDAIICNPPYGLKFSVEYRKKIKKKFPEIYARESYGLFIIFGIKCLKQGGRFVFIVPDTFLTSRNHAPLRRFLSRETSLSHIVQFKSSRFKSVNFGYGSMCIIAGNYNSSNNKSHIKWADMRESSESLQMSIFDDATQIACEKINISSDDGWSISFKEKQNFLLNQVTLGDLAECRTGIYTGDNKRFCAFDDENPPKRHNGHPISWKEMVTDRHIDQQEKENGISNGKIYVPFIRGGHRSPFEKTCSAINWSISAVYYYRIDKKARFQNANFYFRRGLAVPMVTSGRLSASYFENSVFDQGVVGVFPHNEELIYFLLVFLNSEQATNLKKMINPNANNSANYIKRILVPIASKRQLELAHDICKSWLENDKLSQSDYRKMATEFIQEEFFTTSGNHSDQISVP